MPFIQVCVPTQLSDAVKSTLIREIIDRTHEAIGSDPTIINVVIHELSKTNVSVGGKSDTPASLMSAREGQAHG